MFAPLEERAANVRVPREAGYQSLKGLKQRKIIMTIRLTPREREVVRLLSLGCTVREAASVLKLASSTVDNHKAKAMAKLKTNKVALLTRIAIRERISKLNDKLSPNEKRRSGRKNDGWN